MDPVEVDVAWHVNLCWVTISLAALQHLPLLRRFRDLTHFNSAGRPEEHNRPQFVGDAMTQLTYPFELWPTRGSLILRCPTLSRLYNSNPRCLAHLSHHYVDTSARRGILSLQHFVSYRIPNYRNSYPSPYSTSFNNRRPDSVHDSTDQLLSPENRQLPIFVRGRARTTDCGIFIDFKSIAAPKASYFELSPTEVIVLAPRTISLAYRDNWNAVCASREMSRLKGRRHHR